MTPRLSGRISIFGWAFFVRKSLLGIARQWSREKFAILSPKPRIHDRILLFRTWAIQKLQLLNQCFCKSGGVFLVLGIRFIKYLLRC